MLTFGLNVSLIGMGVVFVALVLLVYIIRGISWLASYYEKSTSPVKVAAAKPAPAALRDPDGDDDEIAAVIAAALAAYRADSRETAPGTPEA
jgi:sodium pump decarboxylase gamma subunit